MKNKRFCINRIDSKEGSKIILDKVLLLDKDGKIEVGVPTLMSWCYCG